MCHTNMSRLSHFTNFHAIKKSMPVFLVLLLSLSKDSPKTRTHVLLH